MILESHEIVQVNNKVFFFLETTHFLNDAVRSVFISRKNWMVLESDGNVCIDCSRLLNNLLTLGNVKVSRVRSCYISRETWMHALYFKSDWRKRHARNLFREKDIDHFDNQMCGRHFLLKPGVHKLLEIKKIRQTSSNEMIVDKPTNWKWRYCQLRWISITAAF